MAMAEPDDERGSGWQGIEAVQAALGEMPGGSVVSYLVDTIPAVQAHKAATLFEQLLQQAAISSADLIRRMQAEPRLQRLLWEAARAAADTELDDKIRGLVRMATQAVLDDAPLDVSQLRIRTLAGIEALHLRATLELEAAGAVGPKAGAVSLPELLGISNGVAAALCADLLRLGLMASGGMTFTSTHTSAKLSPYGEEILAYLRTTNA